jgi:hypothetical protein
MKWSKNRPVWGLLTGLLLCLVPDFSEGAEGIAGQAADARNLSAQVSMAQVSIAKVKKTEREAGIWEVVFDAGRLDGVQLDSEIILLRPGAPIVHPLSGEVLGEPQEPVGQARVFELEERRARAVLLKAYSAPKQGDLVEFVPGPVMSPKKAARRAVPAGPPAGAIDAVIRRVAALEKRPAPVKTGSDMRRLWDEIEVMKSYLLALDERLVQTEHRQGDQGSRLNRIMAGDMGGREMEELTIRYSADTKIKLRTAGKTLYIDVEADSIRVRPAVDQAVTPPPTKDQEKDKDEEGSSWFSDWFGSDDQGQDETEADEDADLEELPLPDGSSTDADADQVPLPEGSETEVALVEDEAWYQSPWTAAIMGLVTLAGGTFYLVQRRKEYEELLAELDEDDDLGDDYDDDEDSDNDGDRRY